MVTRFAPLRSVDVGSLAAALAARVTASLCDGSRGASPEGRDHIRVRLLSVSSAPTSPLRRLLGTFVLALLIVGGARSIHAREEAERGYGLTIPRSFAQQLLRSSTVVPVRCTDCRITDADAGAGIVGFVAFGQRASWLYFFEQHTGTYYLANTLTIGIFNRDRLIEIFGSAIDAATSLAQHYQRAPERVQTLGYSAIPDARAYGAEPPGPARRAYRITRALASFWEQARRPILLLVLGLAWVGMCACKAIADARAPQPAPIQQVWQPAPVYVALPPPPPMQVWVQPAPISAYAPPPPATPSQTAQQIAAEELRRLQASLQRLGGVV
jgi:hypothetical protein